MKSCYLWLMTLLTLAFTNGKVQKANLGDECEYKKGLGKCQEFIRCSTSQNIWYKQRNERLQYCRNGKLTCCDDYEGVPTIGNRKYQSPVIRRIAPKKGEMGPTYGVISRRKCDDFATWNQDVVKEDKNIIECGIRNAGPEAKKAKFFEFPHLAHLGYEDDLGGITYKCTASLISEQYLLTAGHCSKGENTPLIAKFRTDNPNSPMIYEIDEIIFHGEHYQRFSAYNDIALLKLYKPVALLDVNAIRPACLHLQLIDNFYSGNALVFSGYVKNHKGNKEKSVDDVYKVTLPYINGNSYEDTFAEENDVRLEKGFNTSIMICANGSTIDVDTCPVYYGGALQTTTTHNCMYQIIGVQSFGTTCGYGPGIYTKIINYIPWIESIVWPKEYEAQAGKKIG